MRRNLQRMNILRFKPNEPTGVRQVAGITADLNLVTQSHPNASVLLLLNGREVLTVFPVASVAPSDLDLEELHVLCPCLLTTRT
jgi:hypothetical protein